MAYIGLQREKKPLAHRMMRRYLLPAFVIGPALAIGLCNPSVAFAAEEDVLESATVAAQPQVVYTEDVFSTNAEFEQSVAAAAVADSSQVSIVQEYDQGSYASENASTNYYEDYGASSEIASIENGASISYYEQYGQQNNSGNTCSQDLETVVAQQNSSEQEYIEIANNTTLRINSVGLTQDVNNPMATQNEAGSVTHYESHEASITFSAGDGGSVVPIANAQQSQSASSNNKNTITENYEDSLVGTSSGARAVADEGFHFVKWIDLNNGNVLSTSENFIPIRPEEGWPYSWLIHAVFAPDVYQVRLDPNGGKAGGGGGSGGPITYDVVPGSDFQLPANGTEFTFAKVGSAFFGWSTVSNPAVAGASTPLAVEDAAVLDSDLEAWLQRLGWLKLDWSGGSDPVVTLYAQWISGQSTITYKASEGGAISASAPATSSADNIATETINAASGMHFSDNSIVGPQGATASASSRHHFVTWDVLGSKENLADSEADSSVLSAGTATRMSRYSEYSGLPEEYHPVTFTAQFAPNAYSFVYEGNGGSGSIASTDVTYGLSAQAASSGVTRSGYKLSGWNLVASGTGTSIALGQTIDDALLDSLIAAGLLSDANGARATLYAQWVAENTPAQPDKPTPGPSDDGNGESGSGATQPDDGSSSGADKPSEPDTQGGSGSGGDNEAGNAAEGSGSSSSGGSGQGSRGGTWNPAVIALPYFIAPLFGGNDSASLAETTEVSNNAPAPSPVASTVAAATRPLGKLAASGRAASLASPIVIGEAISGLSGNGSGEDALAQFASPEAMQAAGATVAAVAAVGVVAGLVGVGVSVAGAAAAGAAVVGTSSAVALSAAADLTADLAASAAGAAGAAGAAAKRRKEEEEEEAEEEAAEHEQA